MLSTRVSLLIVSIVCVQANNYCTEYKDNENTVDVICLIKCDGDQTEFDDITVTCPPEIVTRLTIVVPVTSFNPCQEVNRNFLRRFPALESFWIYHSEDNNKVIQMDMDALFDDNPRLTMAQIFHTPTFSFHQKLSTSKPISTKVWPLKRFVWFGGFNEDLLSSLERMRFTLEEVELYLTSNFTGKSSFKFQWSNFPNLRKVLIKNPLAWLTNLLTFSNLSHLEDLHIAGSLSLSTIKGFRRWKEITLQNLPQLKRVNFQFSSLKDSPFIRCSNLSGNIEELELTYMPMTILVQCPQLMQCLSCGRNRQKQVFVFSLAGPVGFPLNEYKRLLSIRVEKPTLQLQDILPCTPPYRHFNTTHINIAYPSFVSLEAVNFTRFPYLRVYHHYVKLDAFHRNVFENLPNPQHLQSLRLTIGHCGGGVKQLIQWFQKISSFQRETSRVKQADSTTSKELLLHCENVRQKYGRIFGPENMESWQDLTWLMEHLPNENVTFKIVFDLRLLFVSSIFTFSWMKSEH